MDPISPFQTATQPDDAAVAQAEQTVTAIGERLLVERLHRVLDESGIVGHSAFCETMLPYLQGLVMLLPRLVHNGALPAATEAVQILNTMAQESGVSTRDALAEAVNFSDGLRQKITGQLQGPDRPLVAALNQLNTALLEITRGLIVPAAEAGAPAAARLDHTDPATGLAAPEYFEERFGEEILRAQRLEKALTLVLLDVERVRAAEGESHDASNNGLARQITTLLHTQTRGFDLTTRQTSGKFALLLPETNRGGAAAILSRLARGMDEQPGYEGALQFRAGIAVYPTDGKTVHELLQHADDTLQQNKQLSQRVTQQLTGLPEQPPSPQR